MRLVPLNSCTCNLISKFMQAFISYCRICHEFCYQMKDVCKEQTLMDNGHTLCTNILFFLNYAMLSGYQDLFWFFNNYLKFSIFIPLISFKKFAWLVELYAACGRPSLWPPACSARSAHLLGSTLCINMQHFRLHSFSFLAQIFKMRKFSLFPSI